MAFLTKAAFEQIDKNKNGSIDIGELQARTTRPGLNNFLTLSHVAGVIDNSANRCEQCDTLEDDGGARYNDAVSLWQQCLCHAWLDKTVPRWGQIDFEEFYEWVQTHHSSARETEGDSCKHSLCLNCSQAEPPL